MVDKGTVKGSFETLSAKCMPPSTSPANVWAVPSMIDEALSAKRAPVFGASLFRFADSRSYYQQCGFCASLFYHHSRTRAGDKPSTPDNPYIANAVLYFLANLAVEDLNNSSADTMQPLDKACDVISQFQSSSAITPRHIAEVYNLIDRVVDYRTVFFGWDLFSSRDLTITSWADRDWTTSTLVRSLESYSSFESCTQRSMMLLWFCQEREQSRQMYQKK
ncbi:hypothetical protein B0J13DRAFT_624484 [Dactylonectria estremocensis]|uniref:Uncharacterized protein n=1 Tax=Dactylonectria estremocensis TaxID=1079267 RepID=A0A9P9J1A8_9HYPO|nr:hypothetical protein B0J13DRAFT_624484 [Dactylonectria estremocensis]